MLLCQQVGDCFRSVCFVTGLEDISGQQLLLSGNFTFRVSCYYNSLVFSFQPFSWQMWWFEMMFCETWMWKASFGSSFSFSFLCLFTVKLLFDKAKLWTCYRNKIEFNIRLLQERPCQVLLCHYIHIFHRLSSCFCNSTALLWVGSVRIASIWVSGEKVWGSSSVLVVWASGPSSMFCW